MWGHLFGIVRRPQCVVMPVHRLLIEWIFQWSEFVGSHHWLHRLFISFLVSSQIDFVCFAGITRGLPRPLMTIVLSLLSQVSCWVESWMRTSVVREWNCGSTENPVLLLRTCLRYPLGFPVGSSDVVAVLIRVVVLCFRGHQFVCMEVVHMGCSFVWEFVFGNL